MSPHFCIEDQPVEQPANALFAELDWQVVGSTADILFRHPHSVYTYLVHDDSGDEAA